MKCKILDHEDGDGKYYLADVCSLCGNTELIITFNGKKRPVGAQEVSLYKPDFCFLDEQEFDVTGWVRLKEQGDGHLWRLHSFTVQPLGK